MLQEKEKVESIFLMILMPLKNVNNLDPGHSTVVENAYYLCKPPERSVRVSKVRPLLHQVSIMIWCDDFAFSMTEYN